MLTRLSDIAFWAGIVALVAAVGQQWLRPEWAAARWPLIVVGVVLVVLSIIPRLGSMRPAVSARGMRYGLNTALAIVLALAAAGFVEAFSYRYNTRADLTENQRHSLSPQTVQILQNLKTDVKAIAFFRPEQPGKRVAEDLLGQYAKRSNGKLTWQMADLDLVPTLARKYGVEGYGTIVLETGSKTEKVLDPEEEKLTNGLVKVTREGKRVVYALQGHGERDSANSDAMGMSEVKTALEAANYEVKPLVLAREAAVPDDAAVVLVAGPRAELFPPELEAVEKYLGRGGKVLVMLDPPYPQPGRHAGLTKLLGAWGIELGDNLIIETSPLGQVFGLGPEIPIVQQYEPHPITRDLGSSATLFPLVRTVGPSRAAPQGIVVQALARTAQSTWGETDLKGLAQGGQVKPDPQDPKGPLPVAAVATKDKARLVAYGTSLIGTNRYLNQGGNRDFVLNTISWLAEDEDQVSIRPRNPRQRPLFLTQEQEWTVKLLSMVTVPLLAVIGAIVTVVRRRAAK